MAAQANERCRGLRCMAYYSVCRPYDERALPDTSPPSPSPTLDPDTYPPSPSPTLGHDCRFEAPLPALSPSMSVDLVPEPTPRVSLTLPPGQPPLLTAAFCGHLDRDVRSTLHTLRAKRQQARRTHTNLKQAVCSAWAHGRCNEEDVFANVWCQFGAHFDSTILDHDQLTTVEAQRAGLGQYLISAHSEQILPQHAPARIPLVPGETWTQYSAAGKRWFYRQEDGAWAWEDDFIWDEYHDPSDFSRWRFCARLNVGIR